MNENKINTVFKLNRINPGIQLKTGGSIGGNQPPKNKTVVKLHVDGMFAHSPG